VEDSRCSICDDGEGENSNAIVFCDGCNLAVHQGKLLGVLSCSALNCRLLWCTLHSRGSVAMPKMYSLAGESSCKSFHMASPSPADHQSCIFCPNEGGAFKKTTTGHWAHLLCAIWIPELTVGNSIYMEPVQDVELLPKSRWKLVRTYVALRFRANI
jgi:NuA3 HAT complex component NTO1